MKAIEFKQLRRNVVKLYSIDQTYNPSKTRGTMHYEVKPAIERMSRLGYLTSKERHVSDYVLYQNKSPPEVAQEINQEYFGASNYENSFSSEDVLENSCSLLKKLVIYRKRQLMEEGKWQDLESRLKEMPKFNLQTLNRQAKHNLNHKLKKLEKEYHVSGLSEKIENLVNESLIINKHYRRTPLRKMGLDSHTYSSLRDWGIETAEDLTQYSAEEIKSSGIIREQRLKTIKFVLKELGLHLRK